MRTGLRLGPVEVSGGALLAGALLYYLDRNGVALPVLLAALLHEMGHIAAIQALGGQFTLLRLSLTGAELRLSAVHPLSYSKMILAALAGPGTNLLLALGSASLARAGFGSQLYFFAGLNLGLAGFNLLPIDRLDGGWILRSVFAAMDREELGRHILRTSTLAVSLFLLLLGGALLWESEGRNFTLLLAGLWVLLTGISENRC